MTETTDDSQARRRPRDAARAMLRRDRLLATMATRTERTVTLISAGAGFGKSTLIAQALDEHARVTAGRSISHRVHPTDVDGADLTASLVGQVDAIAADLRGGASAPFDGGVSLADRLWHLSPAYVTVVIDDIHLLAPGSVAWRFLDDLVLNLPDNSDAVLSGRGFHELTLARLFARGEAVEIGESDLAFTQDELDRFAAMRSVERAGLDDHGWPALVELEAQAGVAGAHEFVAQEVLAMLSTEHVEALALLAVHDRIDDTLVRAVTSFSGSAAELLEPLPLVRPDSDGTWLLHDLWRELLARDLDPTARRESLLAGATILRRNGHLREAIAVAVEAGDESAALDILVEFARDLPLNRSISDRRSVLDGLPPSLAAAAEAALLRADIVFATAPLRAAEPLQNAIDVATEQNRPEVTVLALLRLGDMGYRSGDRAGLVDARRRLERVHDLGGTGADAALALTAAWLLLLENRAAEAVASMESPELRSYAPVAQMADYYRAVMLGHAGHAAASLRALDTLSGTPDGRILDRRGGFAGLMRWWCGLVGPDERDEMIATLDRLGDDRQQHLVVEGAASTSLVFASAGDLAQARRLLDRASAAKDRVPPQSWAAIAVELATAVIDVMDGDDAAAARRLEAVVPDTGPFEGFARHVFGNVGAVLYLLVPRARAAFDVEGTGADLEVATRVGRALVALREHGSSALAARLPWNDLARLRTWAYEPHLAELALAAMSAGVLRASDALASLVYEPRAALRAVAERHADPVGTLAREELDRTPSRPLHVTYVNVLGPTLVSVDAAPSAGTAPIRRKMVRELLLLLTHRRRMRRDEIAALMWPDKDEGAARNNLRATLNHLRTLLESDDVDTSGPPWHVRSDGESLELFMSDRLVLDFVAFENAVTWARRADAEGRPADTLRHCHDAVAAYSGPYLDDALDPDWAADQRLAIHLDHVDMCVRASELHHARGEHRDAVTAARRAVDAEPLSERAHRAIIRALRSSGDRAGARRAHERCLELLGADGLQPDPETERLGGELRN